MRRDSSHPEVELLDYISGAADPETGRTVEAHISNCPECSTVASVVRALRDGAQERHRRQPTERREAADREIDALMTEDRARHPDLGELASFFYGESVDQRRGLVAAHVALCPECTEAIAIYSRAEQAAKQAGATRVEPVPQKSWDLIRDWEDSSFARPKAPEEVLSQETLTRLLGLMREHNDELREIVVTQTRGTSPTPDLVPVLVVDDRGDFRRVEMFEKTRAAEDAYLFEHMEKSEQFNSRSLHAVLELNSGEVAIVSERIHHYKTLLQYPGQAGAGVRNTGYFIFED